MFSFRSSELGPPPPHHLGSGASPLFGPKGGDTLVCRGGGGGGGNSDEWTDTLVLSLSEKSYVQEITQLHIYVDRRNSQIKKNWAHMCICILQSITP
jgi:hypothetical protein